MYKVRVQSTTNQLGSPESKIQRQIRTPPRAFMYIYILYTRNNLDECVITYCIDKKYMVMRI